MPIYDYHCKACGHRFEQLVKPNETPDCPSCGAAAPERLFSYSASVSTDKTRARSLVVPRRKAGAEKKEKDHAHAEYLRKEMKDHS